MKLYFKIGGITKEWIKRVLMLSVVIILALEIIICSLFYGIVDAGVKNTANSYLQPFENLALSSKAEFPALAATLVENFEHSNEIEVQVISAEGKALVSTSGYITQESVETAPDYSEALNSKTGTAVLKYKTELGEKVMAGTRVLRDNDGLILGSYRWIVSLRLVNRYIGWLIALAVVCGIIILFLTALSGVYFIRSIVNPLTVLSAAARRIAAGKFDEAIEISRDDEVGELCNSINYMAGELKSAEGLKNDLISSVSHELRTPLTAIKGWGETVKLSIGNDDQIVEQGMEVILKETERLSGLVEELLDFSRMQSGRLTVETEEIDIGKTIEEVFLMYAELASKQEIELTYIKPKTEVRVLADKNRIKQVFINVVDNAIKYSNRGGHVIISTVLEENCIRINISDTGVGIAAQDIEHVKEKFYKANKMVRGSGIGLAVADEIIKQHNGLLFIESTEGVGTSVTVVLPIIEQTEEVTAVYFPPQTEVSEQVETDDQQN